MTADPTEKTPTLCNFDMSSAVAISPLPDEQAGRIIKAFCRYCRGRNYTPPADDDAQDILAAMCACQDRMVSRFRNQSEAGRNAANARWKRPAANPCERNADAMRTHSGGNATDGRTDGQTKPTNGFNGVCAAHAHTLEEIISFGSDPILFPHPLPREFCKYFHERMTASGWKDRQNEPIKNLTGTMSAWYERWEKDRVRGTATGGHGFAPSMYRDGIRRGTFATQTENKRGFDDEP